MAEISRQLRAVLRMRALYPSDSARSPTTAMIEASRRWLNSGLIAIGLPSFASTVISCSHAGAGLVLGTI